MSDETVTCPGCGTEGYVGDDWHLYDSQYDSGADSVEDVENAEACTDCYQNDDCPETCNEPHDSPDNEGPDRRGRWECRTTGATYRYCDWCGGWEHDPYGDGSTRYNGEWICEPSNHDMTYCYSCEGLLHYDDAYHDEYDEGPYCSACYGEREDERGSADHSRHASCRVCHVGVSENTGAYFDDENEHVYCSTACAGETRVKQLVAA